MITNFYEYFNDKSIASLIFCSSSAWSSGPSPSPEPVLTPISPVVVEMQYGAAGTGRTLHGRVMCKSLYCLPLTLYVLATLIHESTLEFTIVYLQNQVGI